MGGRTDTTVWTAPPTAGTADSQLMSGTCREQQESSGSAFGKSGIMEQAAGGWLLVIKESCNRL